MLAKYEKRYFSGGEKVWVGRYRGLSNLLHWHSESELIRIVHGSAEVKIGDSLFCAKAGDCLFCYPGELHYIEGESDSMIDVMILHNDLLPQLTSHYRPVSPLLADAEPINRGFDRIRELMNQKPRFYRESLEIRAADTVLSVFNGNDVCRISTNSQSNRQLIDYINQNFATLTFEQAVRFSGYCPSHFSKTFKALTGLTFGDYLNRLKIEYAVSLLQGKDALTVTDVCSRCGFSTIRNFNRVFKQTVGCSPTSLPSDFATDMRVGIYAEDSFDPTSRSSVLV